MNPALMMAAGKAVESGEASKLMGEATKPLKYAAIAVGVAMLVVAGIFIVRKIKAKRATEKFNDIDIVSTPTTKQDLEKNRKSLSNVYANQLRSAFNPSGSSWMIDIDTTSTDTVLSIADLMKQNSVPFSYVASAYYQAYSDDLAKRLQSELSASELQEFYNKAGLSLQGVEPVTIMY